jgi:outer membrane protein assembly factor BamB
VPWPIIAGSAAILGVIAIVAVVVWRPGPSITPQPGPNPVAALSPQPAATPEPEPVPALQPQPAQTLASARVMVIAGPPPDYFVRDTIGKKPDTKLSLVMQSAKRNQITDETEWWTSNGLDTPFLDPVPSTIPKEFQGQDIGYAIRGDPILAIYGGQYLLAIDPATGAIRFAMDFAAFKMPHDTLPEQRDLQLETEWAALDGNILFVSHCHGDYTAYSKGYNGYISAIDVNTGQLLWHSRTLVSNSNNFLVKGDAILTGYGHSAENHYLYILNKADGRVARQMPIRKSIDWLIEHDSKLFVRTYDTDFVFTYAGG